MKRAILILAVAALSGCNLCDDPSTATFRWRFVDARSGQLFGAFADNPATAPDESGCSDAGVDEICIRAGTNEACFPCRNAGGQAAARLAPFARDFGWVVEGWRLAKAEGEIDQLVYSAQGVNELRSCSDTPIQVDLVETPDLTVYYDVNGAVPTTCDHLGVIFELVDQTGNVVWETATAFDAQGRAIQHDIAPCDASFGFVLPGIPAGVYSFSFLQAVVAVPRTIDNPAGLASVYEACGVTLEHFRDTMQLIPPVDLRTAPVAACF